MNTTKEVSLAVVFIAWRSNENDRRRRASAIASAPVAPMAPPSVGVATPRKMVPSTRKMSASGGVSTNGPRSPMRGRSPDFKKWFATQGAKNTPTPTPGGKNKHPTSGGGGG